MARSIMKKFLISKGVISYIISFLMILLAILVSYRKILLHPEFVGYFFEWYLPPFTQLEEKAFSEFLKGYTYFQFGLPTIIQDFRLWSYFEYTISVIMDAKYLGIFYILLVHMISFFSAYILIKKLNEFFVLNKTQKSNVSHLIFQVIPSLYYSFNPFLFNHIASGHIYVSLAYAFLPLLLYELLDFLNLESSLTLKALLYKSSRLAFVLILIGSKINYLFIAYVVLIVWGFIILLSQKKEPKRVIPYLLCILIASIFVFLFHNYILIYLMFYFKAKESLVASLTKPSLDLVLRYRYASPLSYLMMKYNVPLFYSNLVKYHALHIYTILMVVVLSVSLSLLLINYSKLPKKEKIMVTTIMALYALSLGFTQAGTILLFEKILLITNAFFGIFRELYHLNSLVSMGNTFFLYYGLRFSYYWLTSNKFSKAKRHKIESNTRRIVCFSILILILSAPLLNLWTYAISGNLDNRLHTINLSRELEDYIEHVSKDPKPFRILWLPPILNIKYDNLSPGGIDPIIRYSPKPSFGNWLPMNNYAIFVIKQLYGLNKFLYSKNFRNVTIYTRFSGVKHVVYRYNFHSDILDSYNNRLLQNLNNSCIIELRQGKIIVYKCNNYDMVYIPKKLIISSNLFEHLSYSAKEKTPIAFLYPLNLMEANNTDIVKKLHTLTLFYPEDVYDFIPLISGYGNYFQLGYFAQYYDPGKGWSSAYETTRLPNSYLSNIVENFAMTCKDNAIISIPLKVKKGDLLILKTFNTPVSGKIAILLCGENYLLNLKSDSYTLSWYIINVTRNCNNVMVRNINGNNIVISLSRLNGNNIDLDRALSLFFKKLYGNAIQVWPESFRFVKLSENHIALYVGFNVPHIQFKSLRVLALSINKEILKPLKNISLHNATLCSRIEFISNKNKVVGSIYFDIMQRYLHFIKIYKDNRTIWINPLEIYYDKRSNLFNLTQDTIIRKLYLVIDVFSKNGLSLNAISKYINPIKNSYKRMIIYIWYQKPDNSHTISCDRYINYSIEYKDNKWRLRFHMHNVSNNVTIPIVMTTNSDRRWVVSSILIKPSFKYNASILHLGSFGYANLFLIIVNLTEKYINNQNITIDVVVEYELSRYMLLSHIMSLCVMVLLILSILVLRGHRVKS
ncbi:MAG: hypothetical protein J7K21_03185 [Desulfurococcales archaeon]|nr:hypothetical protein [Desulfurococcales archaeon]